MDAPLYEKIKELLELLKSEPGLVYEENITKKLLEHYKQAQAKLDGFKALIDAKHGGSALTYCADFAFNTMVEQEYDIETPLFKENFCNHMNSLKSDLEGLIKGGRSLEERRVLARNAFNNKYGFNSLNSFLVGAYGLPLRDNTETTTEFKKIRDVLKKDGTTSVRVKDDYEFFKVKERLSK